MSRTKSDKLFSSIAEYLIKEGIESVLCVCYTLSSLPFSLSGYDPSICHHISLVDKTCQGYLVKEGGERGKEREALLCYHGDHFAGVMKNWKKRWFVLDYRNEYFAYFETMEVYTYITHSLL